MKLGATYLFRDKIPSDRIFCFYRTKRICTFSAINIIRCTAHKVVTLVTATFYEIPLCVPVFSVSFAVLPEVCGGKLYACNINNHIITMY